MVCVKFKQCINGYLSLPSPAGKGDRLRWMRRLHFSRYQSLHKSLQKPCNLWVCDLLIRLGYSPSHLPRWGRLTNSASLLNSAVTSPIYQNLKPTFTIGYL